MNIIGFMQGRLTNKGGFLPQEFPAGVWEREFEQGKKLGMNCVEWMFNDDNWEDNPIVKYEGKNAINRVVKNTGVKVSGICANYFMKNCIYDEAAEEMNIDIIKKIVRSAVEIRCKYIVLPMFGASELLIADKKSIDLLKEILKAVNNDEVSILLETDASLEQVVHYIEGIGVSNIGICYDIGNAVGLGKDVVFELEEYTDLIWNVHIKDKDKKGTSVMLGMGEAPFHECFKCLTTTGYKGCYIMESYFGESALYDTEINLQYVKENM